MSVLVKGMEMPQGCYLTASPWHCIFCEGLMCNLLKKYAPPRCDERLKDCPLVEVPTPHGKLIDMDELLKDAFYMRYGVGWLIPMESIAEAPTVIEAEEGK